MRKQEYLPDSLQENDNNELIATNTTTKKLSPKNLILKLNELSSPIKSKMKFWNKKSFQVNHYDPSFKVVYLGNLAISQWAKGEEKCLDKPLNTLWDHHQNNIKSKILMHLTICNAGLKALTTQHGLTQYWSSRLMFCCAQINFPKVFCWVYRHEGKRMRQELRCHAVLCASPEKANEMVAILNHRLTFALQEFKREKRSRGMSLVDDINSIQEKLPRVVPIRRQILSIGSANFRPPLERSKGAPKLTSITEEDVYDISDGGLEDDDDDINVEDGDDEQSVNSRDQQPHLTQENICGVHVSSISEKSQNLNASDTGSDSGLSRTESDQQDFLEGSSPTSSSVFDSLSSD